VLELTGHFDLLMAPAVVAVTEATVVARRLGAPSIYSARLQSEPYAADAPAAAAAIELLDATNEALPPQAGADPEPGTED